MCAHLEVVRQPEQVGDRCVVTVLDARHGTVTHDRRFQGVRILKSRLQGKSYTVYIMSYWDDLNAFIG